MIKIQENEKFTEFQGTETYVKIDQKRFYETGEIIPVEDPVKVDKVVRKVNRNGFEITYLSYALGVYEFLGNQKMKVFSYIVEHKNSENVLVITNRELASKAKVSLQTVTVALKILKEHKIINTRVGSIMLLPKVAMRGNLNKEAILMQKFEMFDKVEEQETLN